MFDTLLFHCAICDRDVHDYPERKGRDSHLAPICRRCEAEWTERIGKPDGGTFKDRRKTMQLCALATALHSRAAVMQWEKRYARS